jgi:mono/diheme cytochrome c family protein
MHSVFSGLCLWINVWFVALIVSACNRTTPLADPADLAQVERGRVVYEAHCGRCHGVDLEGQANWRIRSAAGRLPAPPHDDSGHTWHHPDQMLVGIIQNGLVPPYAEEGYLSDMPAFATSLSVSERWDVLAFIKSKWSERSRKFQAEISQREQ